MKRIFFAFIFPLSLAGGLVYAVENTAAVSLSGITSINPPERGFYTKRLEYEGIPIKTSAEVPDSALIGAYSRLFMMLHLIPSAAENLRNVRAELHIIGRNQDTSDLPEHRDLKGKPFDGEEDVDHRTRGLGGVLASCGEENIFGLLQDRYGGRDICVHEFAHTLHVYGLSDDLQKKILQQYRRAKAKGLWKTAYASTNEREYFAELSMWYFGTHGDYGKMSPPPKLGVRWLRAYDAGGYELVDRIYTGAFEIKKRRIVPLAKLTPDREDSLKSFAGKEVLVTFLNESDRDVRIYWLDYEGHRKSYGTIRSHDRQEQHTFATHPFVITDDQDRGLVIFVAGTEPAIATIDNSVFKPTVAAP